MANTLPVPRKARILNKDCNLEAFLVGISGYMKEYFLKLFQYNAWANRRLVACLERQHVKDEKILRIFGHLVCAQLIWYNRFKDLPKSKLELWGNYSLAELKEISEEAARSWLAFVDEEEFFDRVLKYTNYVGDYYETNIRDLMAHLVNHCTYHRGQVALMLREKGFEPTNTDFVTYDRIISGQLKEN
jgi:uncharacterized damage-inducible protein DinB